jgi:hypothetical protein
MNNVRPSTARFAGAQDEANFLCAIKNLPHPELVEGRWLELQRFCPNDPPASG